MTLTTVELIGSAYWASYLFNGDDSGIDERDVALCNAWLEYNGNPIIVGILEDEDGNWEDMWFSWSYGFHTGDTTCTGGDCLTYIALVESETPSEEA